MGIAKILVEEDVVSRVALEDALAEQQGVDLQAEAGFGTGLRTAIDRRHHSERGR